MILLFYVRDSRGSPTPFRARAHSTLLGMCAGAGVLGGAAGSAEHPGTEDGDGAAPPMSEGGDGAPAKKKSGARTFEGFDLFNFYVQVAHISGMSVPLHLLLNRASVAVGHECICCVIGRLPARGPWHSHDSCCRGKGRD